MKKIVLLISMVLASFAFCRAQEGFKITAETSGVPDGKMLLISERGDTLATADMVGGKFEFTGRVDRSVHHDGGRESENSPDDRERRV